nr:hypothetical protein [Tanacetum cinerariifolium]
MEDLEQQYLDELKRLSNLEYRDEIKIAELTKNLNGMSIEIQKKENLLQQEQWAYLSTHPSKRLTSFCYDDDDDYNSAITPVLSTEEPVNFLTIGDEHLDTISATESDKVIKSSVEDLVPVPSESEGISEHKCDVPFHDNSPPLDVLKDQFMDFSESNNEVSSIDDDSFSIDNIDYVEASPPAFELVSSEVMEIVIPEVGGIDDDIPLTIKDDNLRKKMLNVNLLIATIEALNDNPTPSSDCKIKSSSTSLNSLLEENSTFHNSLLKFENFYFDLREVSSGSTTTHSDISLSDYEAFYFNNNHIKEISSGSTTTHSDISLSDYEAFYFNNNHIKEISSGSTTTHYDISLSEYDSSSPMNSLTSYLHQSMIVYTFGICPIQEPVDSLSIGDEHLDTIPATESDEVIKSSVEDLVPILSEFEGILDTMCDVHLDNNHTPLEAKDHFEIVTNSNDDNSSSDDDSLYNENIEYVEASPHDSELVSLEAAEIVILEEEEIEDDNLREKLLNVHLLIANIEALKDNLTQYSELLTKSSSTSLNSLLEETSTFHNSFPEFENFYFDLKEISSDSTTTHSDISLSDYKAFYFDDDHVKEISSGIRRNAIVKFNAKVKFGGFNDENDVLSYFMFVIFAKEFSLLSAESEDTIFDPGLSLDD